MSLGSFRGPGVGMELLASSFLGFRHNFASQYSMAFPFTFELRMSNSQMERSWIYGTLMVKASTGLAKIVALLVPQNTSNLIVSCNSSNANFETDHIMRALSDPELHLLQGTAGINQSR